ncbi:hypothetical protein [Actinoallomurus sp. NPDC050550]|uniref:hypothetical protein n=1 Tax=Actinoallomurus sp. NPDC050550 TaxID=3154937 RepID=UPI0033D3A437
MLFADEIDDLRVVVMRDEGDKFLSTRGIARYVERKARNREHRLAAVRINDHDGYAPAIIGLVTTAQGVRYLFPPWRTNVRVTDLSAANLQGRSLAVRGGVTDPIRLSDEQTNGSPCRGMIALQATERRASGPELETFISALGPGNPQIAYHPDVAMLPDDARDRQQPITTPDQWQAIKDVACRQGIPAVISPTHINIWPVWHGRLPHGGDASAHVAEVWSNDRGHDTFAVFDIAGEQVGEVAGAHSQSVDMANGGIAVVVARWRAPSGRWCYTAAGNQHINRIQMFGQHVSAQDQHGRFLTTSAPPDDEPPAIATIAYDTNNHPVASALPTTLP